MEKDVLEPLVQEGKTQREIAACLGSSQTTVRYWLNKHELVTRKLYLCRKCGETKPSRFLKGRWTECRKCRGGNQSGRFREYKRRAVEYKGGECEMCGYKRCLGSLDFHHRDPKQKDPRWRRMRSWTFERIKKELDKCMLVCKNCHGEIHYGDETQGSIP